MKSKSYHCRTICQISNKQVPVVGVRQRSVSIIDEIGERGLRGLDYTHVPQSGGHFDLSPAPEKHLKVRQNHWRAVIGIAELPTVVNLS